MEKNRKIIFAGTVNAAGASVRGQGKGICTLTLNKDRKLTHLSDIECRNGGIITSFNDQFIYAANEVKDFGGLNGSGGGVSAYSINQDGSLSFLNSSISYGSRTSYVTVSESGRYLLAANHGSHSTVTCSYVQNENGEWILKRGFDDSSIAVFALNKDGSIGHLTDLKVFEGSGYWCHGGGQSTVHFHCVKERNHIVYAMSRGSDEIIILKLDEETGKLELIRRHQTRFGYAPRHAVLHPLKEILYCVNENYPSVSVYEIKEDDLNEIQLIETMDEDYYKERPLPVFTKPHADENEINSSGFGDRNAAMCSDIHVSQNGKHLYASTRRFAATGALAVYDILENGQLRLRQIFPLKGKDPRGFNLIQDDSLIIIGLLDQNLVQIFEINEDGTIGELIDEISLDSPSSFTQ